MGLDSVDIIMGWEESFGISITNAEAELLRTPRQSIDLISAKLEARDEPRQVCLTQRAFHRLRKSITTEADVERARVQPNARLRDLVGPERQRRWEAVRSRCGISALPRLGWFSPGTVGDLANWAVAHTAKDLKGPGEPWTRSEIRTVVRAVVTDVTGVKDFTDDDDFVRDIGID